MSCMSYSPLCLISLTVYNAHYTQFHFNNAKQMTPFILSFLYLLLMFSQMQSPFIFQGALHVPHATEIPRMSQRVYERHFFFFICLMESTKVCHMEIKK